MTNSPVSGKDSVTCSVTVTSFSFRHENYDHTEMTKTHKTQMFVFAACIHKVALCTSLCTGCLGPQLTGVCKELTNVRYKYSMYPLCVWASVCSCAHTNCIYVCVFSGVMSDCPSCDRYGWLTPIPNVSILAPQRQNHQSAVTIWTVRALLGCPPHVPVSKTRTKNTTSRMLFQKHQYMTGLDFSASGTWCFCLLSINNEGEIAHTHIIQ